MYNDFYLEDGYSICSKVITLHSYSNDFREIFSRPSWEEFKLGFHTVNSYGGYRFFSSSQIPSPVFSENSPCLPKLSKTSVLKSLDLRYDHIEKQEKMSTWSILKHFKTSTEQRERCCVCVSHSVVSDFLRTHDCSPPGYSVHEIL